MHLVSVWNVLLLLRWPHKGTIDTRQFVSQLNLTVRIMALKKEQSVYMNKFRTLVVICLCVLLGVFSCTKTNHTSAEIELIKSRVDSAYKIVEECAEEARAGRMSTEVAKSIANKKISELRFDNGKKFVIVFDSRLVVLVHPLKPDLQGKNFSENRDPVGNYFFRDMRTVASKNDGGFSTYFWPKPGSSKLVEKVAFSKLYQPWGWIISSSS